MPGTRSAATTTETTETEVVETKESDDEAKAQADAAAKEAEEKAQAEKERREAVEKADAELAEGVVEAPEPMPEEEYSQARQKEAEENAPLVDDSTEDAVAAAKADQTTSPVRTAEGAGSRLAAEGATQTG